jgi:hypothetical protein
MIGGRAGIISNSDSLSAARFLRSKDKSTMNLFAIDSLIELREDKLGLN